MNIKPKIILSILTSLVILVTNLNSVKAVNITAISPIELHSRGTCQQLLKYKGTVVKTTYVEYTYNKKNYPAYCLDKTLPGITSELIYSVDTNKRIEDLGLWRIVINGYPYKSLSELGVANDEEAFTATKQAIYCYLFENTPSDYEAIGEAGQRTLNALNMIVTNGQNSKETQNPGMIEIKAESEEWIEDENDSKYIYKIYSLSSNVSHLNYEIVKTEDMPEKSKITNIEGKETTSFSYNEKFKIMLLKDNLNKDGQFRLNIKTELKTKPVIYGASPNTSWQNYALTGYMYEETEDTFVEKYKEIKKVEIPEETVTVKDIIIKETKILPVTGM